jgi:hypothetical protein
VLKLSTLQFWYEEHIHYALLCVSFFGSHYLLVHLQGDSAVGVSEHRVRELEMHPLLPDHGGGHVGTSASRSAS